MPWHDEDTMRNFASAMPPAVTRLAEPPTGAASCHADAASRLLAISCYGHDIRPRVDDIADACQRDDGASPARDAHYWPPGRVTSSHAERARPLDDYFTTSRSRH